jgi:hypothetical protein
MSMHGELVNGLCYTAFVPVYLLWLSWWPHPPSGEDAAAGIVINFLFVATAIFS